MLRTVQATRYVLPLREGGSLPAIVEADDLGLYVVKFRGAGQGILALIAELIAGEIGRALGLRVPDLVLIDIDPALGRNEPDAEIRQLLKASAGLNVALDYLPGSTMFDPAARDAAPSPEASLLVWFDAFVLNVDRTPRNANLLVWHRSLYPIDHGAALFFHHNWPARESKIESPFMEIEHHILLPWANEIEEAAQAARQRLTPALLADIVNLVPDSFFAAIPAAPADPDFDPAERRAGYIDFLTRRLAAAPIFEQEAIRARTRLL
ncbi:MAG: HipA family kinase [Acidobacteriaceae bacterium]